MDLSKLSMAELKKFLAEAAEEEKRRKRLEFESAVNEIYDIARRLNVPLKDLMSINQVSESHIKTPMQYRNPENKSQEWTGRGRPPNWVKELIAAGKDIQTAQIS